MVWSALSLDTCSVSSSIRTSVPTGMTAARKLRHRTILALAGVQRKALFSQCLSQILGTTPLQGQVRSADGWASVAAKGSGSIEEPG
jgi:hypothetical protein